MRAGQRFEPDSVIQSEIIRRGEVCQAADVDDGSRSEDDPVGIHEKEVGAGIVGDAVDGAEEAGRIPAGDATENVLDAYIWNRCRRLKPSGFRRSEAEVAEAVEQIRAGLRALGDFVDVPDLVDLRPETSGARSCGDLGKSFSYDQNQRTP